MEDVHNAINRHTHLFFFLLLPVLFMLYFLFPNSDTLYICVDNNLIYMYMYIYMYVCMYVYIYMYIVYKSVDLI